MKVFIIAGYTPSLINFRGDLIREMVEQGHEVFAAGPELGYERQIADLGAKFIHVPIKRADANPFHDIKLIDTLRKLIRHEKPDVVFSYTVKPVIYGSIAAYLAGVRNIYAMVTGLGYVFVAGGFKAKLMRAISKLLYYTAIKTCEKVFFQNPDDINEFVKLGLIKQAKCELVNGSGVNLDKYKPEKLPDKPVFLMICRVLRDKGVMEFLHAARNVKLRYPDAKFQLVGPFDANPNSLTVKDIKPFIDDDSVEYLGEAKDVRPFIASCSAYVLPSYREGTPRTVLEAMAMGRPIITTDAPGCRETVKDGENGFLVPVRNVESLTEKICWMIENSAETERMAERSLAICQDKYDVKKINHFIMKKLGLFIREVRSNDARGY